MKLIDKFDSACFDMKYGKIKRLLRKNKIKEYVRTNNSPMAICIANPSLKKTKIVKKTISLLLDNNSRLGSIEEKGYSWDDDRTYEPSEVYKVKLIDKVLYKNDLDLVEKFLERGEKFSPSALDNYTRAKRDQVKQEIVSLIKNQYRKEINKTNALNNKPKINIKPKVINKKENKKTVSR